MKEIILVEGDIDFSIINKNLFKNDSLVISFDFNSHKSLNENNIKHKLVEEYFDDVIGVTIPENRPVEKIEIFVIEQKTKGYIETKPLHETQTPLRKFKDGYKFSIKVIPNNELESLILSFGENIKILSPERLKESIKSRLLDNIKNYD